MPRLGLATIDISTLGGSGGAVTGIDDFFFESFTAGQMHPILTTSRTNLVIYSEDFSQASQLQNINPIPNSTTSPIGTANGTKVLSTDSNSKVSYTGLNFVAGTTYTVSVFCKNIDATSLNFFVYMGGAGGDITHDFTSQVNTSDWTRVSHTFTATGTNSQGQVQFARNLPNGQSAFFWGFQLEQDGFVSAYIPTSGSAVTVATTLNDTSNVWDFDGTDIMIAEDPEDEGFWEESYPDGATLPELVLNGDYEELGSDLVINGGFELNSDWNNFGSPTTSEQSTEQSHTGTYSWKIIADATQEGIFSPNNFNLTSGRTYSVSLWVYSVSGNSIKSGLNNTNVSVFTERTVTVGEWTNITYIATASSTGASYVSILSQNSLNFFVDNVSVKQVDPNDRWTLTGGASISDGKATVTGASGTTTIHVNPQTMLVEGTTYELTYTISNYSLSSGVTAVINNNGSTIQGISGNGTFTAIFTHAIPNGNLIFRATSGTNSYQLDNVSVKEYAIQPKDI